MKSGTSTLKTLLNQSPAIFIPAQEIHYFSVDDILDHPDFFVHRNGQWTYRTFQEIDASWYHDHFPDDERCIGEDSTTYLSSRLAPERIANTLPGVRMLFVLRNPVARAYSHYRHLLQRGGVTETFENAIRYERPNILRRGFYKRQLQRYHRHFPDDRLKVLFFEDLVEKPANVVHEISTYLGVEPFEVDTDTHENKSRTNRSELLQRVCNWLTFPLNERKYLSHLNVESEKTRLERSLVKIRSLHNRLNLTEADSPSLRDETVTMLNDLYAVENEGLSELIDKKLPSRWPSAS